MATARERLEQLRKRKRLQELRAKAQAPATQQPQQTEQSFIERHGLNRAPNVDDLIGGVAGFANLASGMVAEPIAGLAGLAAAADPFAPEGAGGEMVDKVRDLLTLNFEAGRPATAGVAEPLRPVVEKLEKARQFLGDGTFKATGRPALAALATTIPDATLELLGAGVGKRAALKAAQKTTESLEKTAAISGVQALEDTGIRQLTSDVFKPENRASKFLQQQGEIIPLLSQRPAQQAERIRAIEGLVENFDIIEGARYEADIVEGIKDSINETKRQAGELFDQSTMELDKLGSVPLDRTREFARDIIRKQEVKGSLAEQGVIDQMNNFINAPENLTFESVKSIRSGVGRQLANAKSGAPVVGSSDTGLLSQLYKQLSTDMRSFANQANPELASRWQEADRFFSDFATGADKPGIKNLIKRGEATPELINNLLFSNKKSDHDFLSNNLTGDQRLSAKRRILQNVVEKASSGEDFSTIKFEKQMEKLSNQIDTFFDRDELTAINSLRDALRETRRAGESGVVTATGQQVVPLLAFTNPSILIPGVIQTIIERPGFRNILIRRKAAKTARERMALDLELQNALDQQGIIQGATKALAIKETLKQQQQQQEQQQ